MPRLEPPTGFCTAAQAAKRLDVSDSLLSRYVQEGKLHRYGPPERKHKFYKVSELDALQAAERFFYAPGQWKNHPSSTFERATEHGMPAIVDIDTRTFGSPAASLEISLSWLDKNPDSFFALKNAKGVIVGYAEMLPLKREVINRFIRDEIDSADITPEDIPTYAPGEQFHLYVMAIAIDPNCTTKEKHEYGARLVTGLFAFLLSLAEQGIEIQTITARSYKPDGLRLLRKMGFPQLRSPTPGKDLFVVNVPESGFSWFVKYSDRLTEWKQAHHEQRSTSYRAKRTHMPVQQVAPSELPVGTLAIGDFADQLGITRRTLLEQVTTYDLDHIALPTNRPDEMKRFFTPDQQEAVKQWRANRATRK